MKPGLKPKHFDHPNPGDFKPVPPQGCRPCPYRSICERPCPWLEETLPAFHRPDTLRRNYIPSALNRRQVLLNRRSMRVMLSYRHTLRGPAKRVFRMLYDESMTYRQIATKMNITFSQVRTIVDNFKRDIYMRADVHRSSYRVNKSRCRRPRRRPRRKDSY